MNTTDHLLHSAIIGTISYLIMVYILKQSGDVALDRSVLITAFASIYMILFGHSFPPGKINPNVF
jgi:hypothetical protein